MHHFSFVILLLHEKENTKKWKIQEICCSCCASAQKARKSAFRASLGIFCVSIFFLSSQTCFSFCWVFFFVSFCCSCKIIIKKQTNTVKRSEKQKLNNDLIKMIRINKWFFSYPFVWYINTFAALFKSSQFSEIDDNQQSTTHKSSIEIVQSLI